MLKVSFVGFRRHSELLRKLFEKQKGVLIYKILTRSKNNSNTKYKFCSSIEDLFDSDIIVISSPTPTHSFYLSKLTNFKGYIFCEKPIVSTKNEIERLLLNKKINKNYFYTNFNFRFSVFSDLLKKIHYGKKFGKITKLHIHISHSSAYRNIWRNEWRLKVKSGLGPLETSGIHFIDFAKVNFGKITKIKLNNFSQLNIKNEIDTSDVYFMAGKTICNFRFSYAESHKVYFLAIFKNGYAEYNGKKFNIYYPMKNFNKKQKSIAPNLFYIKNIDYYKSWKKSNDKSIKYFFSTVLKNKKFYNFDHDLKIMKPFLYNE